ncbi:hypothetical protein [Desulfolutivibrio sulfoxidireducens]|uniref:hypothetical protein n=1 Tax=Desulfolutivibrio sulfoxidireducens TaxID=2773299 RepID=UPI00159E6A47|nr:hypothetical protein [Desulfolutivibrio sulfoxidireducens]
MQRTEISPIFQANDASIANRIDLFFDKLSLRRLAARCGITKRKGISPRILLMTIFALPFLGQNIFRGVVRNNSCEFGKDAVYDFLGSSRFSWRRLLLMVAIKATAMLDALTGDDRETVLILDDTSIHRPGPRKWNSSPGSTTTARIVFSGASVC